MRQIISFKTIRFVINSYKTLYFDFFSGIILIKCSLRQLLNGLENGIIRKRSCNEFKEI